MIWRIISVIEGVDGVVAVQKLYSGLADRRGRGVMDG
jgi:hypothetical protein